jgi:hypothetical protein
MPALSANTIPSGDCSTNNSGRLENCGASAFIELSCYVYGFVLIGLVSGKRVANVEHESYTGRNVQLLCHFTEFVITLLD